MNRILSRACMLLAGLGIAFSTSTVWADLIAFQQAPVNGGLALFDDIAGFSFADNFSLASGTNVSAISWWGGYANNALPASSDFTITIYSDSGGVPGPLVASYSPTAVSRTATGLSGNDLTSTPESIYEFTYALPSSIALATGSTYFLSIVDNTSSISSWLAGTGDAHSYVGNPSANLWASQSRDFAFELSTHVVPEPASIVVLGGLTAGTFIAGRFRRKR